MLVESKTAALSPMSVERLMIPVLELQFVASKAFWRARFAGSLTKS